MSIIACMKIHNYEELWLLLLNCYFEQYVDVGCHFCIFVGKTHTLFMAQKMFLIHMSHGFAHSLIFWDTIFGVLSANLFILYAAPDYLGH